MDLLTPAIIGIGLSMDCFAVSLAIGTTTRTRLISAAVIIALFFGLFQAGMTVIGWAAGTSLIGLISAYPLDCIHPACDHRRKNDPGRSQG